MFSKKALHCFLAVFSSSMAIFFKKIALLDNISPLRLLLQFMIIAAIILTINLLLFQKKYIAQIKKIKISEWKMIFLAGFFLFSAYLASTYGLHFTTSINYSFIIRTSLIFSTILSFFFMGESMYWQKLLLIVSSFLGVYLVSTEGKIIIPRAGDLFILMGAFFFASFAIAQKIVNQYILPELISWGVISSSAFYSILLSIIFKVNIFSIDSLFIIFIIGIFEGLAILFMNQALKVTSVTYYYLMTMLMPVINGFLGIVFLNESFKLIQILGGIILILSVIIAQRLKI